MYVHICRQDVLTHAFSCRNIYINKYGAQYMDAVYVFMTKLVDGIMKYNHYLT